MRYSKQRSLILDIVQSNPVHPTAEWVHKQAKKVIPTIGIATVYRNLNTLSTLGELQKIPGVDGVDRFDADQDEHYHMQCTCCGKLIDLQAKDRKAMEELRSTIDTTFDLHDKNISISSTLLCGLCNECADTKKN